MTEYKTLCRTLQKPEQVQRAAKAASFVSVTWILLGGVFISCTPSGAVEVCSFSRLKLTLWASGASEALFWSFCLPAKQIGAMLGASQL